MMKRPSAATAVLFISRLGRLLLFLLGTSLFAGLLLVAAGLGVHRAFIDYPLLLVPVFAFGLPAGLYLVDTRRGRRTGRAEIVALADRYTYGRGP